jgi:hypothetical protein
VLAGAGGKKKEKKKKEERKKKESKGTVTILLVSVTNLRPFLRSYISLTALGVLL